MFARMTLRRQPHWRDAHGDAAKRHCRTILAYHAQQSSMATRISTFANSALALSGEITWWRASNRGRPAPATPRQTPPVIPRGTGGRSEVRGIASLLVWLCRQMGKTDQFPVV